MINNDNMTYRWIKGIPDAKKNSQNSLELLAGFFC